MINLHITDEKSLARLALVVIPQNVALVAEYKLALSAADFSFVLVVQDFDIRVTHL